MLDQRKIWAEMAVEDLFLAVSGGFSGFKPIFQRSFRRKSAISKKCFALRHFFTTLECCIGRKKRKLGEIWAFYRESYDKGKHQLEKGKKRNLGVLKKKVGPRSVVVNSRGFQPLGRGFDSPVASGDLD